MVIHYVSIDFYIYLDRFNNSYKLLNVILDAIGIFVKIKSTKTCETENKESNKLKKIMIADNSGVEV